MKHIANLLGALTLLVAMPWAMHSHADNTYVGVNYTDLELTDGMQELSIAAGSGRLGVSFNKYVSFEWRAGTGLSKETMTLGGSSTEYILDKFYGGYLRGGVLLLDRVYPYLMVGHTWVKLNVQSDDAGYDFKDHDTSFGIGVDIKLAGAVNLNLEYSNYYNETGARMQGPTIGLAARFYY